MNIFKKYSYWWNSGKYSALQKFSVLGMGIVSFMLLTRTLGTPSDTSDFGVWGLFLTISSITETARTALIRNAFIRFMHQKDASEHGRLQSAALMLSVVISSILAMIFLLAAYPVAHWLNAGKLADMLQWYALTLVISVVFAHCEMLLNAKMDFRGVCWMYCVRQGVLLLSIVTCYLFRLHLTPGNLAIFYLVSMIAGSATGWIFSRTYLQWQFNHYRSYVRELWHFGKYVFGNNVSSLLFRSTDNFVTSRFFGPGVSAYYNASLRIGNLADLPSQVLGDVLFPKAAKFNSSDKASIRHMYERTVGAILIFSIPSLLVLFFFPTLILHIVAGRKFLIAAPILRITAFFGFTLPFLKQFGTIMDATGHPRINFQVMFLALCIDIVTNLVGVHFFGVIGAAIGTATTYLIIFIIIQVILNRMFGVYWLNVLKQTFLLYKEIFLAARQILRRKKAGEAASVAEAVNPDKSYEIIR